jgi:hypothetical protein
MFIRLTFVICYGLIQSTIPELEGATFTRRVIINHIFIKLRFIGRIPIFAFRYIWNHDLNFFNSFGHRVPRRPTARAFAEVNLNTAINFDEILRSG